MRKAPLSSAGDRAPLSTPDTIVEPCLIPAPRASRGRPGAGRVHLQVTSGASPVRASREAEMAVARAAASAHGADPVVRDLESQVSSWTSSRTSTCSAWHVVRIGERLGGTARPPRWCPERLHCGARAVGNCAGPVRGRGGDDRAEFGKVGWHKGGTFRIGLRPSMASPVASLKGSAAVGVTCLRLVAYGLCRGVFRWLSC